jgi:hypothetical protein
MFFLPIVYMSEYCNIVFWGDTECALEFITTYMTDKDLVLPNWWAKKVSIGIKLNIWLNGVQSSHTDAIVLVANLADPQVVEKLNFVKSKIIDQSTCVIVLGVYKKQSSLTETVKIKVLEWMASSVYADQPFLEIDLTQMGSGTSAGKFRTGSGICDSGSIRAESDEIWTQMITYIKNL